MTMKINDLAHLLLIPISVLALLLSGCASTDGLDDKAEPYEVTPEKEPDSIGFYLANLDTAIRGWNRSKLEASSDGDDREVRAFERTIQRMARLRMGELIAQLESGPPANRTISAVALGFTGLEEALSPLLSALEDPEPQVVSNALLGIGQLENPATPLAQICHILRSDPDAYTRNNAAFAMQRILLVGGEDPCAMESAREALLDSESAVRSKAALILYLVRDTDSIEALSDLLYDDEAVVSAAAATALSHLGRDEVYMGATARVLVVALDRVHPKHRLRVLHELRRLRGADLGEETEVWRDWAYRLP